MILSFDTATRATAVALCGRGGLALEARDDPPPGERPRHNTRLLALVTELLERAGAGWPDIERIVVGIGPGTFTGLRIGIATARALALAQAIPLVGVSTLRSLAFGALAANPDTHPDSDPATETETAPAPAEVIAVLDARRGELFAAGWREQATGEPFIAPTVVVPEALAELLGARRTRPLAVGEGALAFRELLERAGAAIPEQDSMLHRVSAINHCRLAAGMRAQAPDEIHPEYLRLPDAELARRSPGGR